MMNKNDIKQQIAVLLEKIQEQARKINEEENDISQEQLDIILSNTRELYEKMVVLNYVNSSQTETSIPPEEGEEAPIEMETQEEPAPVEEDVADPVSTETSEQDESIEEVPGEEKPQIDLFAANPPPSQPETALSGEGPTPSLEEGENPSAETPSQATVGSDDGGGREQTTINEQVALQEDVQSVASELEKKPITDLSAAIGINEKFLFINELFGGSTEDYNDSLDHLNKCKDHAEAGTFINDNLKEKYHWDEENNAVSVFLDLVERRYL